MTADHLTAAITAAFGDVVPRPSEDIAGAFEATFGYRPTGGNPGADEGPNADEWVSPNEADLRQRRADDRTGEVFGRG